LKEEETFLERNLLENYGKQRADPTGRKTLNDEKTFSLGRKK